MKTEIVQLPSGAAIEIRQLTLKEENYLSGASRSRKASQERVLIDVVSRCTVAMTEPGPYPGMDQGSKVKWDNMLSGDFFATMVALRKLSYREGAEYDINLKCPNSVCNNRFVWTVDLDKDLVTKPLSEEVARAFSEGRPLTTTIAEREVRFSLGMVKDAAFQEQLEKRFPFREMACILRTRIVSVEGVDPKDLMNWLDGEGQGPFDGLTADDGEDLRAVFYDADCGIDTEIEVECSRAQCRNVFQLDLPFEGILSPGRAQAKRRAMRAGLTQSSED